MVLFPNCKINLGLRILGKRNDGYHDLETIFYPLPLTDAAEINICYSNKKSVQDFELTLTGLPVPGNPSQNLCTKAFELIRRDYPGLLPLKMHLHKTIPIGAGLGGGSSDGAFTLLLMNRLLQLHLTDEQLMSYALELGSDCPFFILNKPCLATGRGEILKETEMKLLDYHIVLVDPGIHINTAWAFSKISPAGNAPKGHAPLTEIIREPVNTWKNRLVNDFEDAVFDEYPSLQSSRDELYALGAEYASMTGTGGCLFGIFGEKSAVQKIQSSELYRVYHLNPSF